ncbi:hypothetical protein [Nocardia sp. CY41]|uniref:hypothetical protein n=1 Tax=Nocardia sp. CY41 TaxID=2608686 RepID=UPI001F1701D4|nr:hypothetical protein [Nocardia sp. CY41]
MTSLVEAEPGQRIDPTERIDLLLRDLRGSRRGLTTREAAAAAGSLRARPNGG